MDNINIFYYDKYNRKIKYTCSLYEFRNLAVELLEKYIDNGVDLYYTYKMETKKLDYYNIPGAHDDL